MKKLILSTVALAALTFASCKKDNLQPTTSSTTNIEQQNIEAADDDKVVDARTKFVGTWKRTGQGVLPFKAVISKTTNNRLKIVQTFPNNVQEVIYVKVNASNKLVFSLVESYDAIKRTTTGTRNSSNVKKLAYKIVEKDVVTGQIYLNTTFNLVKQ